MNDLKIAEQCIPKECKDDLVSRRQVYCLKLASESDLEFGRALIDMPSAEPEPKQGHYIGESDGYSDGEPVYDMWYCSECDYYFEECDERPTYKFCYNCGAKMEVVE